MYLIAWVLLIGSVVSLVLSVVLGQMMNGRDRWEAAHGLTDRYGNDRYGNDRYDATLCGVEKEKEQ